MDRETLDREEVDLAYRPAASSKPPAPPFPAAVAPAIKPDAPPQRTPILGAPPGEPAGA